MTSNQATTFSILIDALWSGECSEAEFFEVGLDLGASIEELTVVLNEVRNTDGVCQ